MTIIIVIIILLLIVAACLFPKQVSGLFNWLKYRETSKPQLMTREQMETLLRKLMDETKRLDRENAILKQRFDSIVNSLNTIKKEYDTYFERLYKNVTTTNSQHKQMIAMAMQDIESLRSQISSHILQSASVADSASDCVASPAYPEIKYARFLDMDLNGFRESELSSTAADSIFEIIMESHDSASFHLVTDESMRRQLFSMLNHVVSPACDIIVESTSPERIVDNTDGLLIKDGDIWTIRKKASVKLI